MSKVRCIRMIEMIGTPEWIKEMLNKAWLQPGEVREQPGGTIEETQRVIQTDREKPRAKP